MAKPTKHAPQICLATGAVMAVGAVVGLVTREPLWAVAGLMPITIYEVYRTEGESTRWASWVLLASLALEAALLLLRIDWTWRSCSDGKARRWPDIPCHWDR